LLLITLALIFPLSAAAVEETVKQSGDITSQEIDALVATLENDARRKQLVQQLKLLQKAQQSSSDHEVVSDLLDLSVSGSSMASELVNQLEEYGWDKSAIGSVGIFLFAILLCWILIWLNNKASRLLNRRLKPLRRYLHLPRRRFASVFRMQRWIGGLFALTVLVYVANRLIANYFGSAELNLDGFLSTVLGIAVSLLLVSLIWEVANALLEQVEFHNRHLSRSRLQTIMPVLRNFLLFTLSLLTIMVVLSEMGVNIMPLLAGAGVLGIAIGFGAQTLVKDFLNGAMVIFEDLLQIGDVVKLGDLFGEVEKISIRKLQMRDLNGTVHTIPFSEISIVSNLTKDYSYYLLDVGVAYRENVDDVISCMQEVADQLRQDDDYRSWITGDFEVLGVDRFADSAVMIKARIKTQAHQKWVVGREYNRRLKHAFDERNIEIPFPHQTLYFGEDKQGVAPAARVELQQGDRHGQADVEPNPESKPHHPQTRSRSEAASSTTGQNDSDGD
jgi:small conductance mechanosensitive channel